MDYDIIIIGGGCAGLTAAVYSARAGVRAAVFEANCAGGQIVSAPVVENYPAILKISGAEFAERLLNQAKNFNVQIVCEQADGIDIVSGGFNIITNKGTYSAKSVILACGLKKRKLNVSGEDKFLGRGVSYCAVCDGMFFKNKTVCVVGGGNSALNDALHLSDICENVYLIHRRNEFKAEKIITNAIKCKKSIKCVLNSVIKKINGNDFVNSVSLENIKTGAISEIDTNAVFVAIGKIPDTNQFLNIIENKNGFIITDGDMCTSVKGIYAAGDCRMSKTKQLTTAASDGTVAALSAAEYIKKLKLNL